MGIAEKRERLYAAITDPDIRALAEEVVSETFNAAEERGWRNAVGYLQDGQCDYPSGLPERTGARAFVLALREAGMAKKP